MKKDMVIAGVIVILLALFVLIISMNAFEIRGWIVQNLFSEEKEEENSSIIENDMASEENTIQPLITAFLEESTATGEMEKLLEELVFPDGSKLTGYHVKSSEHPVSEGQDFSYSFRIIIPMDEGNNFVNMLTEKNFYSSDKVFLSAFSEVNAEDALYTFECIYVLYNEGYCTSGVVSICMTAADSECIVFIEV